MQAVFKKNVSKGALFNQIYVPKNMNSLIEPGDLVEVRLLKRKTNMYYYNLEKLSDFKESVIKRIFSCLNKFEEIKNAFIVGSFLNEKINYNDIDIILLANRKNAVSDEKIYSELIEQINIKLHILTINEENLNYLLKACPLTISMFNKFISNKKVIFDHNYFVDKKHIQMLLMMPEDLLEIDVNTRVFFDNLRRLITIERFLDGKSLDNNEINSELKSLLGEKIFNFLKNNELIENFSLLRGIIKDKINKIKRFLKDEQKRRS